jgi:hypothetical protein
VAIADRLVKTLTRGGRRLRRLHLERALIATLAALAVIGWMLSRDPVFSGVPPVAALLDENAWRDSTSERAPWAVSSANAALDSKRFEADSAAFVADLLRTGSIGRVRAESLAASAVREAYVRRVPPALVLGVLMAENDGFSSTAASSAGAVGLMQVNARVWIEPLKRLFGSDLENDHTNLRYGIFILSHYIHGGPDSLDANASLRRGLLRYNGCVRGTTTPACHRYPEVVRSRVERFAISQCGSLGYDRCVQQPLRLNRERLVLAPKVRNGD